MEVARTALNSVTVNVGKRSVSRHVFSGRCWCVIFFGLVLGVGTNTILGQQKSAADDKFAAEAASGGMAEVKLGELAQEKGTSDKVKDFGQKMVTDHSKAGDDLKQIAPIGAAARLESSRRNVEARSGDL